MQKNQQRVYKRSYPNLDSLFGHPFSNVIGEPITPMKMATIYVMRICFQIHFGFHHEPTEYPMTLNEKRCTFYLLAGLFFSQEDLTYDEFRCAVLNVFLDDEREFVASIYTAMESIAAGETDINLWVEDEFYTNKYARPPHFDRDDGRYEWLLEQCKDDLHFSSPHSHMYRWLKRILGQFAKTSTIDKWNLNKAMKRWILRGDVNDFSYKSPLYSPVSYMLNCSLRSRWFVNDMIYKMTKNPIMTYDSEIIYLIHATVQYLHPDVFEAYIMEAISQIQDRDAHTAIICLKKFFDLSMFELNEDIAHFSRTHRMGVPTHTPMMYAPIIQARVHRWFGDLRTARFLLTESLQQAQIRCDEIAHQMANVELHTVDYIGGRCLLEDKTVRNIEEVNDRRIVRKALKHINDLPGHHRAGPCCISSEDDFELIHEMDSYGKMIMVLKQISEGTFKMKYHRIAEIGITCPLETDPQERGDKVNGYGYAIMTSNMIRNGMYEHAETTAQEQIVQNQMRDTTEFHRTEAFCVTNVNMAYALAAKGEYDDCYELLNEMNELYPEEILWRGNDHIHLAAAIIMFEREFLGGYFIESQIAIDNLAVFSVNETKFRQSILWAAMGRTREAIKLLQEMETSDIYIKIRIQMQLGSFHTYEQSYIEARKHFEEAVKLVAGTTFRTMRAMINRRISTMLMCKGEYVGARLHLRECYDCLKIDGTYVEKACMYMTLARIDRLMGNDPRPYLGQVRHLAHDKWPTMEKMALAELVAVHMPDGPVPDSNRLAWACGQFGVLEEDYPGRCDWLLM
ncbi:hypothetical protein L5515_019272 [Caenorhabditis briggsae]|uniref:Uncharacterized protein n=2 Tax=Caenorhabditis briggsae TaxID=6238 RepID=A0AAE9FP21_CAEBR|nr:hypothetical protein L5515_019272 [Caenorhabditis briggsae]